MAVKSEYTGTGKDKLSKVNLYPFGHLSCTDCLLSNNT